MEQFTAAHSDLIEFVQDEINKMVQYIEKDPASDRVIQKQKVKKLKLPYYTHLLDRIMTYDGRSEDIDRFSNYAVKRELGTREMTYASNWSNDFHRVVLDIALGDTPAPAKIESANYPFVHILDTAPFFKEL
jgi:hypothetical protein